MTDRRGKAPAPLRLHATDAEDLQAVSAALSSATVKRGDMTWDRRARRFALVCNRFRWEGDEVPDSSGGSRIRAGVRFSDVQSVQALGLNRADQETVLELLSVECESGETPPEATVTLTFAGGPQIRLAVECVDVLVDDMGRAWYTPNRPRHDTEDGGGE
ncbi:MAG: DUF2948 family protein [Minwuia sp.]|uniref:DUF2948 family protein n=1 Tax=Minwuia sp. TaxID=2493630 RepID=UPI003A83CFD7